MAMCEMCGYDGMLHRAVIEGTMLHICSKCLRFGEAVEVKRPADELVSKRLAVSSRRKYRPSSQSIDDLYSLVSNYSELVKNARQKQGKSQQDLGKAIAERSSVIQRIETGNLEPSIKLAKKLQQFLKIQLIEKEQKVSSDVIEEYGSSSSGFTIGDVIKRKK
jgi:putative transcription factor